MVRCQKERRDNYVFMSFVNESQGHEGVKCILREIVKYVKTKRNYTMYHKWDKGLKRELFCAHAHDDNIVVNITINFF